MLSSYDKNNFVSSLIPINILKDKHLTFLEKLLLIHIISLCKNKEYCWATNKYFCEIYNVSKQTISKRINNLVKYNYIQSKYCKRSINVDKRKITLSVDLNEEIKSIQKRLNTSIQDSFITSSQNKLNQ